MVTHSIKKHSSSGHVFQRLPTAIQPIPPCVYVSFISGYYYIKIGLRNIKYLLFDPLSRKSLPNSCLNLWPCSMLIILSLGNNQSCTHVCAHIYTHAHIQTHLEYHELFIVFDETELTVWLQSKMQIWPVYYCTTLYNLWRTKNYSSKTDFLFQMSHIPEVSMPQIWDWGQSEKQRTR